MVCITRGESDPAAFLYKHDVLWRNQDNIAVVREFVRNDVSSTAVRCGERIVAFPVHRHA